MERRERGEKERVTHLTSWPVVQFSHNPCMVATLLQLHNYVDESSDAFLHTSAKSLVVLCKDPPSHQQQKATPTFKSPLGSSNPHSTSLVPRPRFPQLRMDYITATWKVGLGFSYTKVVLVRLILGAQSECRAPVTSR